MEDPTYLYRIYGDHLDLLYVGITENPDRRIAEHSKTKWWWPEAEAITWETYPTRESAERQERYYILCEWPVHNVKHNEYWSGRYRLERLCYECGERVAGWSGVHENCKFDSADEQYLLPNGQVAGS